MRGAAYVASVTACYAAAAVGMALLLQARAFFPTGSDALTHLYKSQALLSGLQDGTGGPLLDPLWDNCEQLLLSWAPLPALTLAGCLALARGGAVAAFSLLCAALLVASGAIGAAMGAKLGRRAMGAAFGALWFFLPNNAYLLLSCGDVPAAMVLALLPPLVFCSWWWIQRRTAPALVAVTLSMAAMVLSQPSDAALVACALAVYLVAYGVANRSVLAQLWVAAAAGCGLLLACAWLLPSLLADGALSGGMRMANPTADNWAALLNPVAYVTRTGHGCYFGIVALSLVALGILSSPWRQVPAFVTALLALLAAPFALGAAGGALAQYQLWQLSLPALASVALGFALTGLMLWGSMRAGLSAAFCALLALGAVPGVVGALSASDFANAQADAWLAAQASSQSSGRVAVTAADDGATWAAARLAEPADTHHPALLADALPLLEEAKALTTQRLSIVSGYGRTDGLAYAASGTGLDGRRDAARPVALAQGADWESSALAGDYRLLDEALEEGDYPYLFDRNVELGCDILLVRAPANEGFDANEVGLMDAAAKRSGWSLVDANGSYRLYRIEDAPGGFGSTASFPAIAIGRNADATTLGFPAAVRGDSDSLDDYSFEELSEYRTVLLCGIDYRDQANAEDLVRRLAEAGTRVVVMADGIPENRTTHDRVFLGVRCNVIDFEGGFPELDTIGGTALPDLFPFGTGVWKTVYLEGLDDSWGRIDQSDLNRPLDFIGTVENENIVFIGLNLTYYYSLTRDSFVGQLLGRALDLSPEDLPERTLEPTEVSRQGATTTIAAGVDDVATGVAWTSGLASDAASEHRGQVFVDAGTTTVEATRPHAVEGLVASLSGLALLWPLLRSAQRRRQAALAGAGERGGER